MAGVGSEVHHNIMVPMLNHERERGERRGEGDGCTKVGSNLPEKIFCA